MVKTVITMGPEDEDTHELITTCAPATEGNELVFS